MTDTTPTGTVKWFDATKGFGFIRQDEPGADDLFVHVSALEYGLSALTDGQRVTYTVTQGRKGLQAADVSAI